MIIDGRTIASEILKEVRAKSTRAAIVRAVVVMPSPATDSYLAIKEARAKEAGMRLEVVRLSESATNIDVIEAIEKPGADAVIVQLPLPEHLDSKVILDKIPVERDADVLSALAYSRFKADEDNAILPPVVASIAEVLERSKVFVAGKGVTVVGQGRLVGIPAAAWLVNQGAEVTVVTREEGDLSRLEEADVIITGAGSPALIQPHHIQEGVVLIDAGTSESGGAIVGDVDPACASKASVFTPVPGGIGPIAVACLFRNVMLLMERGLQEG
ncbi:MAG: bifunctional 5,10-methylenetetrahydrofolate dehydrogenase/5,10-methenyltetrahydrofolate cyclohydrolase [bacterium]|nr:bifunctional 5,10-methylenetetrahydrofolate dehydrogenase/5,10-methenyltetrahydrofolate cyclohydrolase [bacterium]